MRKDGFYWVKRSKFAKWEVGEWENISKCWTITDCRLDFVDDDFLEIDENRIERNEVIALQEQIKNLEDEILELEQELEDS